MGNMAPADPHRSPAEALAVQIAMPAQQVYDQRNNEGGQQTTQQKRAKPNIDARQQQDAASQLQLHYGPGHGWRQASRDDLKTVHGALEGAAIPGFGKARHNKQKPQDDTQVKVCDRHSHVLNSPASSQANPVRRLAHGDCHGNSNSAARVSKWRLGVSAAPPLAHARGSD